MRSGASAAQQTLTAEAASVLKQSLSLAARRGHGQVTPLHVAATLLSSRGSLLKRACLKSHPNQPSHPHPLHGRALELCFSVALNRLPTSPPLLHGHPSLSNALIAALKRAQAHQRRGCIEQQQQQQHQQPLLTIKVELEQLIISILDDPSVSRVMREAGFSSTSIKNNIEDCSVSSVFHCYSNNNGDVFSSPCSPDNIPPEIIHPTGFWPTHFLSYSSCQNPLLFSPPKKIPISQISDSAPFKDDVTLVFDVLMGKKRRNTVIVGDSLSITGSFMSELMRKIKRGEAPNELKSAKIVEFPLTPVSLKFMKKEDVKTMITDLKKDVGSHTSRGVGVIIHAGDLNWVVESGGDEISDYNQVDHLVAEIESLISNNGGAKVWLMATSSYQVYMRCQMRQPPLETQWALQSVSVPSGGLSLSLHASGFCQHLLAERTHCCVDCSSNYEREIQHLKLNQLKQLPLWLQPREIESRAGVCTINFSQITGEFSPISSDLTRETPTDSHSANGLLESIENHFTFNRKHHQNQDIKDIIISKLKKASEEIIGNQKRDQFSIEDGVVEEIAAGFGSLCNSSLEKWVKEVFQTSLNKCRYGGKDGVEIRLCLDSNQNSLLETRFLASSLPNHIEAAFLD